MPKFRVLDELWKRFKPFSIILGLLLVFFFPPTGTCAQSIKNSQLDISKPFNPRVLILHSYHYGFTWSDNISKGIRSVFDKQKYKAELIFEFMDTRRIVSEEYFQELKSLFEIKYRGRNIDVIICSDDHALNFMLKLGEKVFPNVPIVFCSVSGYKPSMQKGRQLTGLIESIDIKATLDIALKLHPGIKEVAVITDMTRTGRALRVKAEKTFLPYQTRLRFNYLEELVVEDLWQQVSSLSKDSIIFLFIFSRDKAGHVFSHEENLTNLAKYSKVPIYAVWEFYLGHGIVGGKLTSGIAEGKMVGELALRILNGEKASDIPPSRSPVQYMFDYNQMRRFNVKESMLPANSIIINKPFSFYKKYKPVVWTTILIFLLLVTTIITLHLNITKRKRAEYSLRESEEKYRKLFEDLYDVYYRTDDKGIITILSPSVERYLGYQTDELIGQNMKHLYVNPQNREEFLSRLFKDGYVNNFEAQLKRKDNSKIWASTNAKLLKDKEGKFLGVEGISRDVTDRKELESQLVQVQKMESIGTLAGGIAHDFNNILSSVLGYTELSLSDSKKGTLQHEHLQEVLIAGGRAKDLVKQILTFSRQVEQDQKPIQVKPIVKEALKLLRVSIPTTIDIKENLQSNSLIIGDSTRIHQVLLNLGANAAHAMEDGGVLTVTLSDVELDSEFVSNHPDLKPGPYINLTVTDTGHGISPSVMKKIFDPFFTTKDKVGGTGLGLSVVHGIVRSHGGDIYVYSEPGKGSTFKVYLPAIERRLRAEEREDRPVPTGTERILYVDDEPAIVNVSMQLLDSLGYDVTTRTSSIEALELFKTQNNRFDLVITDMTMPQMTGEKLAEELIKIRSDIPIILCTGFSSRIDEKKALSIGIRAFISKPILKREIAEAIRMAIDGQ